MLVLVAALLATVVPATPALAEEPPPGPAPSPWTFSRLSAAFGGGDADGESYDPSLSADGNHVAFETYASNLAAGPVPVTQGNNVVKRLDTGAVDVVSLDEGGGRLRHPRQPAVSADGSVVVQTNGVAADNTVTLRDRTTPATTRVSPFVPAHTPSLSEAGDRVAYLQGDANPDDADVREWVWLHDTGAATGTPPANTRLSNSTATTERVGNPVISGDGTTVAYDVRSGRLGPAVEARVLDVRDPAVVPAPLVLPAGRTPVLSRDGTVVVYAHRVGSTDTVRVHDRTTGEDRLVVELPPFTSVTQLDVSADGRVAAYVADGPGPAELWVTTVAGGRTEVLAEIKDVHGGIDVGPDGRTVVFASAADDIVSGDENRMADVFLAVRRDAAGPAWPVGARLTAAHASTSLVTLVWPAADDDVAVASYQVAVDGRLVAVVASSTLAHTVGGLDPETTYTFSVVAVDSSGNASTPITVEATTLPVAEPGTAALAAVAGPGGTVTLTWDPAAGPDGYTVLRAEGDGDFEVAGATDEASTSFADAGLAAATRYRYRVDARTTGGDGPHTVEAEVTTPDIGLDSVSWQGRGVIDSALDVTVQGAPGWTGSVEVVSRSWYAADGSVLEAPRSTTGVVAAPEDAAHPGRYLASVPVTEGTSEVTSVTAVVADGHGAAVRLGATRFPLAVRGALRVVVDAPTDSLPGARVVIDGLAQLALSGGLTWDIPSVASGDRTVKVLAATGHQLGSAAVTVVAGRRAAVTVAPALPAWLSARVTDSGGLPVEHARVSFVDEATAAVVGTATTDGVGLAAAPDGLLAGARIGLRVTPPLLSDHLPGSASVSLVPGDNLVDIRLEPWPAGYLTGRVTVDDDVPAAGALVTASQTADGRWRSYSTLTGADGRYDLRGIEGPARVSVSYRQNPPPTAREVTLGQVPTTLDLRLAIPTVYRFELTVLTRTVEDPHWRPRDIDPLVGQLLQLSVANRSSRAPIGGPSIPFAGSPGDTVQVCGDGRATGLSSACETVTLGKDATVAVELHLQSAAGARGRVVDAGGRTPSFPTEVRVTAYRLDERGRSEYLSVSSVREGRLDMLAPTAGRYRLQVTATNVTTRAVEVTRMLEFDLAEGEALDLGTVALRPTRWTARSSVTATRSVVNPGGYAEVRASLRPDQAGTYTAAVARLRVPAGAVLLHGSVTVDGRPVTTSGTDGTIDVNLGDLVFTADPGTEPVVVRYRLGTAGIDPGTALVADVGVRATVSGTQREDFAGSVAVSVAGVTLAVAKRSTTGTVEMSGRAPAGAVVRVLDHRAEVGRAEASPGGLWRLTTTLPDYGTGFEHRVQAFVDLDETTVASAVRTVVVDDRQAQLTSVRITEAGGRAVTLDPRNGVARFPLVYRSGPITVGATFAGRGSVENVQAQVGSSTAKAQRTNSGEYLAVVASQASSVGDIGIRFDPVPAMAAVADSAVLTEEQVRAVVPPGLADYHDPVLAEDHDPASNTRRASVTVTTPRLGADARMRTTLSVTRGLVYTPTAADLAAATRAGVPLYGLTYSASRTPTSLVLNVSGYVPEDVFDGPGGATASLAAGSSFGVVRIGFQRAFTGGGIVDGVVTGIGAKDKYDRIGRLTDWVNANCDTDTTDFMHGQLNRVNNEALASDGLKAGLMVAALVAGPATFGIGTVGIWAVGFFLDKMVDVAITKQIDAVAAMAAELCRDDEEDPRRPDDPRPPDVPDDRDGDDADPVSPVAQPVWMHDPSGFVFEAVPSNRLEGVTTTVLYSATPGGPFEVWDADWYGQINPMVTDPQGAYGWDVPDGYWQVVVTGAGYEPVRSEVLEVLPPHFDVNLGMASVANPDVASISARGGTGTAVEVTFSRYMQLGTADLIGVAGTDGSARAGAVTPVDAEDGPTGRFARSFRFTPAAPFAGGETLTVSVDGLATSYSGRPMTGDVVRTVTVRHPDATPPTVTATVDPPAGPGGWHTGPVTVTIAADDGDGDGVARIEWSLDGAASGSGGADGAGPVAVPVTAEGDTVLRFWAVDRAGNTSDEQSETVRVDGTAPSTTISSPTPGARFMAGTDVTAAFDCADAGSGVASCVADVGGTPVSDGGPLPTDAVGTFVLTVTATDGAGHSTIGSVAYEVVAVDPAQLLDGLITTVWSYQLPAPRRAGLLAPLKTALYAVRSGNTPLACLAMTSFDWVVGSYTTLRWLTAAQAGELRAGSAEVRSALGC